MVLSKQRWAQYIAPLLLLIGTACTSLPAQTPPQLQQTPGVFIVLDGDTVQTPAYAVDVPTGWKIVKSSIAAEPITLVFAAPDNTMIIHVSENSFPEIETDQALIKRQITIEVPNGPMIYLWGEAQAEFEEAFYAAFERVSESIRLPD
jgi:hypothetical protein